MTGPAHTLGATAGDDGEASAPVARPYLFRVLTAERPLAASHRHALAGLAEVRIGRAERDGAARAGAVLAIGVDDRWLSTRHASVRPEFGRWVVRDDGSRNGVRVNGAAIAEQPLADGDVIEAGHTFFVFRIVATAAAAPDRSSDDLRDPALATLSPALADEYARVAQLAASALSIIVLGESGSGKELLADGIHRHSNRPGRLVAVNCGALPAGLIESELFGHKRGAFSGAVADHEGLVAAADRGTLFLDEVADLPPAAQVALLRVLEQREVRPVGGAVARPIDLRIVSATHLDLAGLVERGLFRRDLYARLAGYRITLPPLRARREDLGIVIATILRRQVPDGTALRLELAAARLLVAHDWPLNARELVNCLMTARTLAVDGVVGAAHLGEAFTASPPSPPPPPTPPSPPTTTPPPTTPSASVDERAPSPPGAARAAAPLAAADLALRDELASLLAEHGGNLSAVARALGKDRKQIQRWIKRLGLGTERPAG